MKGTPDSLARAGRSEAILGHSPATLGGTRSVPALQPGSDMSRQDANAAFALTSFLYGSNAPYVEDLYARYEADPASVDGEWQAFFASLKGSATDVTRSARGASWKRRNWPQPERGELVSALDGDWREVEKAVGDKIKAKAQVVGHEVTSAEVQQATRDSIRALMLIRA